MNTCGNVGLFNIYGQNVAALAILVSFNISHKGSLIRFALEVLPVFERNQHGLQSCTDFLNGKCVENIIFLTLNTRAIEVDSELHEFGRVLSHCQATFEVRYLYFELKKMFTIRVSCSQPLVSVGHNGKLFFCAQYNSP